MRVENSCFVAKERDVTGKQLKRQLAIGLNGKLSTRRTSVAGLFRHHLGSLADLLMWNNSNRH